MDYIQHIFYFLKSSMKFHNLYYKYYNDIYIIHHLDL